MNREDIIRMLQEAREQVAKELPPNTFDLDLFHERFAALVAAAEREACAKVCESLPLEWEDQPNIAQAELATMMDCALAIRARSDAE
jgi:hypothetical protein